ncbi:hypothetical protein [Mucilaginibacter boryungensis]|uniref:Uncharacterized protein n=1 Tax=Mucilaginibacter boryungensis TaxID=768480 RepID=A0ABR9XDZ8_9SPHI|nr:hypothetical protein [Mucilaginibacter boryungensis]MBE9665618.1 hypothetical protein [Mucilaginibacter boryungensis]
MNTAENANATHHYVMLVIATVIGLVGVYLRFAGDSATLSAVSNLIMVVAVILSLRTVFAIMK